MALIGLCICLAVFASSCDLLGSSGSGGTEEDDDNLTAPDNNDCSEHIFDERVREEMYIVSKATCTEAAVYYYACRNCGAVGTETYNDPSGPNGHRMTLVSGRNSTCTEMGWKTYEQCMNCDYNLKEMIPMLEHSYTSVVTEPTCAERGFTTHTCHCGDEYIDSYTERIEHVWSMYTVKPTCEDEGYAISDCQNCDAFIKSDIKPALGHISVEGICERCRELKSKGLSFVSNGDGTCYVNSVGSCQDAEIYIPWKSPSGDTVIAIGSGAFSGVDTMISITLPSTLLEIKDAAFSGCHRLVEIINHSELEIALFGEDNGGISDNALMVHNGSSKIVIQDDFKFVTVDGVNYLVDYIGNGAELRLPASYNGERYNVYNSAFKGHSEIRSLNVPGAVDRIYDRAFYGCNGITEAVVSEGVKAIGDAAFGACSSIESITLPFVGDCGTENYSNFGYIFGGVGYEHNSESVPSSLKRVVITGGTAIYARAFWECSGLESITLPESLISIGEYAFYACRGLVSITLPSNLSSIADGAFSSCRIAEVINKSGLIITPGDSSYGSVAYRAIVVHNGESKLVRHGDYLFYEDYLIRYLGNATSITLPEDYSRGAYGIWKSSFEGDARITSVVIPDCVTGIEVMAFYNCDALKSVKIGAGVTRICATAFAGSSGLEYVEFAEGSMLKAIDGWAFEFCSSLISIDLPSSLTSIGEKAFNGCRYMLSVTLNSPYVDIASDAFDSCYIIEVVNNTNKYDWALGTITSNAIEVHSGESKLHLLDGFYFYTCNGVNYLVRCTGTGSKITLPDDYCGESYMTCSYIFRNRSYTEVVIGDRAILNGGFAGSDTIKTVRFKPGVTAIPDKAFQNCGALETVTFDAGSKLETIGAHAFYGCNELKQFSMPANVKSVGYHAFYGCDGVCTTEDGLIYVDKWIIGTDDTKSSVTVRSDTVGAVRYAFESGYVKCFAVASGNSAFTVVDGALYNKDVTKLIAYGWIWENGRIPSSYYPPSTLATIGAYAFANSTTIMKVDLTSNVESIEEYAFVGCDSLSEVRIGADVRYIGCGAFKNSAISSATLSDTAGWSVILPSAVDGDAAVEIDRAYLSDVSEAASYLRWEYADYTWIKE